MRIYYLLLIQNQNRMSTNKPNIKQNDLKQMQNILFGTKKVDNNSFGGWENYVTGKQTKPKRVRNRNRKKNSSFDLSSDEDDKKSNNSMKQLKVMVNVDVKNSANERFQQLQRHINEMVKKQKINNIEEKDLGEEKSAKANDQFNLYDLMNQQKKKQIERKENSSKKDLVTIQEPKKFFIFLKNIDKDPAPLEHYPKKPKSSKGHRFYNWNIPNNRQFNARNWEPNIQSYVDYDDPNTKQQLKISENIYELFHTTPPKQEKIVKSQTLVKKQPQKFLILLKNQQKLDQLQEIKQQHTQLQPILLNRNEPPSLLQKLKQFLQKQEHKKFHITQKSKAQAQKIIVRKREGELSTYLLQQQNPQSNQCDCKQEKMTVIIQINIHQKDKCTNCTKKRKIEPKVEDYTNLIIKNFWENN